MTTIEAVGRIHEPKTGMRARRYILTSAALALAIALTAPIDVGSPARAQPAALTAEQSKALETYDRALNEFKTILNQRRRQIDAHEPLPDRPGQALYLARVDVMSPTRILPMRFRRGSGGPTNTRFRRPISTPISNR